MLPNIAGIVVHALAYGQRAEQSIAELSQQTGGKTFFYSGRQNSTALIDGLAATVAMENNAIPRANVPQSVSNTLAFLDLTLRRIPHRLPLPPMI